ncbi:unnamed protein product [Diatraea saccharalis]|uniref:Uncharacterized protein n=1 Tax=Diatraea saccharalis TaxID=40085 RepID=A0A9N9WLP1_9NEOP|nr:unnamed protein product [Diatraea saccharalis]
MTLSKDSDNHIEAKTDICDDSNWDSLYCSHLWSNSKLRKAIITASYQDKNVIKYCYRCRGKIRKYEIQPSEDIFLPNEHSTPTRNIETRFQELPLNVTQESSINVISLDLPGDRIIAKDIEPIANVEINQTIPTISRQIDSSFRQKFVSDMRNNEINQSRLRKSLKGIGCIVNLALNDNSVKKRTHIQACSISVMILAIIVISFVLVNFTNPNYTRATTIESTIVVPIKSIESNETSSPIINFNTNPTILTTLNVADFTQKQEPEPEPITQVPENTSLIFSVISKIRKNVRTFPKNANKESLRPKDIINRDVSQRFCSCQINEVCMLDENSGTAVCKKAIDIEDPTGCGGLCTIETEACQLVDRLRGVRVCRLLSLVTCLPEEWRCRNGLCVKADQRCDGSIQCYDRSDEMHCDCDLTKQFRCGHSISCFSNTKLCDGIIDCWDGYDELNCTTECPGDQFTCTNGQCILSSRFCDNLADCVDGSDEPHGCDGGCSAQELRCANSRCVPRAARCDGRDHCGDASDELHCS